MCYGIVIESTYKHAQYMRNAGLLSLVIGFFKVVQGWASLRKQAISDL